MLKELLQNKETIKKRIKMLQDSSQTNDYRAGLIQGQVDIYKLWLFSIEQLIQKDK